MSKKQREKCSYLKGHHIPSRNSYQQDLFDWWEGYACRGEYTSVDDISCAIGRLIDYITSHDEAYNDYGFDDDLSYENRLTIISQMLQKMQSALIYIKK